ncbi:GNAT family N-acetyltransferase [Salinarimonas soli]|uniref:GNAT family N-acetyltransferase n=1 Tax=Salinarimonas soli TaxID=1638099 RepID=A0A5B2VBI1_9HYPH|nr:GNAT family N-acetyltransferase [Salinarimonas soli]KAA2236843.1 GNAT family N-acetyltransferase [Salinarimonas soli]
MLQRTIATDPIRLPSPSLPATGIIRRLWPGDVALVRDHLLRLDPDSRRSRFTGAVSDAFLETYAERALLSDGLVLGYRAGDGLRGVAELQMVDETRAEAAFSVEAGYRRRGVGAALFRRILLGARNRGARTVHLRCLPHNRAMQALARRHGARLVFDGDEMVGEVATRGPTPASIWEEAFAEGLTLPLALLDRRPRLTA